MDSSVVQAQNALYKGYQSALVSRRDLDAFNGALVLHAVAKGAQKAAASLRMYVPDGHTVADRFEKLASAVQPMDSVAKVLNVGKYVSEQIIKATLAGGGLLLVPGWVAGAASGYNQASSTTTCETLKGVSGTAWVHLFIIAAWLWKIAPACWKSVQEAISDAGRVADPALQMLASTTFPAERYFFSLVKALPPAQVEIQGANVLAKSVVVVCVAVVGLIGLVLMANLANSVGQGVVDCASY